MGVIFLFSSQTGAQSTQSSQFVLSFIQFLGIDVNSVVSDLTQLIIRKGAHLFEYFVLSLLIYNLKRDYVVSIVISFLYACTDEIHLFFVVNRVTSFEDVLVDTLGATFAMILFYLIKIIKQRKMNN